MNENCLKASYKNEAQPKYLDVKFGLLVGPDEQCAMRHGPDFVFRGVSEILLCYNFKCLIDFQKLNIT